MTLTWKIILKSWRTKAGLLQKEAAEKLGVSVRTYQGWEEGKSTPNRFARVELERRMKPKD